MKKIIFILFVVAVIASLILFRLPLIQQLSPKLAKHYGLDVNRFEVSQFDVDKIVVPMLAMQQVDGALRTTIEIHDLVIDIEPYQAKVSAASSSYVYVDIEQVGSESSAVNDQGVKELIDLLPIFGISIERLKINYRANSEELVRFDGQLSYAQKAELKGALSSQDNNTLDVDVYVDELDFNIDVSQADDTVMALKGGYQLDNDWLDLRLKGDVSLSMVNQFLLAFGVDQYVHQDVTSIKANFELDLTRSTQEIMQSFAADIDVDSTLIMSSKDLGLRNAQVDISASCRVERMDTTTCLFKDPQRAVVDFYQAPTWLVDYFDDVGNDYIFEVNPNSQLRLKLSLREILFAEVDGSAAINVRTQSSRIKIDGAVSDISFNGIAQDWQLDADYQLTFEARDVSAPARISRLLTEARGRFSADEEQAKVYVDESFVVNALNADYDGYKAKIIRFNQLGDGQYFYQYKNNRFKTDDVRFDLTLNQLINAEEEMELMSSPVQMKVKMVDYSSTKQKAVAQINVSKISLTERGLPVQVYELNAGVNLQGSQFSIDGGAGLGEQKDTLNFYATHDLVAGIGRGAINADAIVLANNEIISKQIAESGFPLQLKGGSLDVGVSAIWNVDNAKSEFTVKLLADQVMGDYAQNQFSGFNTTLEFVGQDGWSLKQAANINIDIFNIGVPVKDVSMRLERMEYGKQDKPVIRLSDLAASLLDGSIYSEEIEIDLNRRENIFTILMSSLSLEKLIALNQTEDLVASGTINGKLPMRLDNGVLLVDEGWLRADENGGYIKYGRIGEVLAGNKNLELVGELLEDFRYNEMSAQVDLLPDGRVTLATKLHGRSPNAELNKQVNLNFNIDFNLWKFLESARLLTRIDQDVTKKILSKPKR